ncbi:hypothetical protein THOA03_70005 [Vibrio owensii]|nr:hypothetical protein THOA03_70005 [Vibrio owensii]
MTAEKQRAQRYAELYYDLLLPRGDTGLTIRGIKMTRLRTLG